MNKVYSLDTYRHFRKAKPKEEAIKGCEIRSQKSLDAHFTNIQAIADLEKQSNIQVDKKDIS